MGCKLHGLGIRQARAIPERVPLMPEEQHPQLVDPLDDLLWPQDLVPLLLAARAEQLM